MVSGDKMGLDTNIPHRRMRERYGRIHKKLKNLEEKHPEHP